MKTKARRRKKSKMWTKKKTTKKRNERKKERTESGWYAKEIKLFILYGADKKRPFTHSATNKVICSE